MQAKARNNRVLFAAASVLLAAAAICAHPARAAACGQHRDFAVGRDPVVEAVRPADCATLLGNPPEFTWALQGGADAYTVALTFPDGHTETRSTPHNWLAWDRPVPAGDYTWRVSIISGAAARKSDARAFRVDAGAFVAHPQVASARGSEEASAPAGAPVFELQSAESWVPFARSAAVPRRATGGFFGGFTE